jgi:hypothetical protein
LLSVSIPPPSFSLMLFLYCTFAFMQRHESSSQPPAYLFESVKPAKSAVQNAPWLLLPGKPFTLHLHVKKAQALEAAASEALAS